MKINNTVLFENKPCKITRIAGKLYELQDNKTKERYYTVLSNLKGILITNYLLEKLGFKKYFRTFKINDIEIYNKPIATMQVYYYKGNRIKYIHELENIINELK